MPNRTRTGGDDDDLLPQIIKTIVEITTKSAESSTSAAKAIQSLEGKVDAAKASSDHASGEVVLLKAEVANLSTQVKTLTEANNRGFLSALYDAIRNPQTLLILAALIAAIFGLRLTLPALPLQLPGSVPATHTTGETP